MEEVRQDISANREVQFQRYNLNQIYHAKLNDDAVHPYTSARMDYLKKMKHQKQENQKKSFELQKKQMLKYSDEFWRNYNCEVRHKICELLEAKRLLELQLQTTDETNKDKICQKLADNEKRVIEMKEELKTAQEKLKESIEQRKAEKTE
ncbi:Hypothetical_protein [Hexamita inflata]|uniref:Hypothetical_protein n=1 Tax=Hexamita inflata TaxID=28002 RepID=A0AA86P1H2_9EUKA|nr:Hypothetical protein HINF_LOCUS16600 [Hexamita inflata]